MNRRQFLSAATATALTGCSAQATQSDKQTTTDTPAPESTAAFKADLEAKGIDVLDLYDVMGSEVFVAYVHDEQNHNRDLAVTAVTFAKKYTHLGDSGLTISPGVKAGNGYEKHGYTFATTDQAKRFKRGELSRTEYVTKVQNRYEADQ